MPASEPVRGPETATSTATLTQPSAPKPIWRRIRFLSPQITVLVGVALVLLLALIVLAVVVLAQVQASGTVLGFNDTNRVFVQLQRETLRMLVLVVQPSESFVAANVQTQTDLIQSRIGVMDFPVTRAAFPPHIQQEAAQIQLQWANLKGQIEDWKADPTNESVRQTLRKAISDFELLANQTEIDYARNGNLNVSNFAQLSQQQLLVFAVGALILVTFMFIVAISVFRFNQQRQEVEAIRETNRLKDEFLAVVSHELRTPLNAIIGFLGILKMGGELDERSVHMVDRARANAVRLLALINDILDVSKIEAGKFELLPAPVSLRPMIERWQSQMDSLAKQKGLEFHVHVEDSLPEKILVDEDAVTKIATNLLSNAFKFTEKGKVSLEVKGIKPDEWLISVADTGIGIPDSAKSHIFESFRQADSSTRRSYGGTGLGLSIVKRLSTAMGGSIQVESRVGEGSTFTVRIPLKTPI